MGKQQFLWRVQQGRCVEQLASGCVLCGLWRVWRRVVGSGSTV
jgi:hypothetical protein